MKRFSIALAAASCLFATPALAGVEVTTPTGTTALLPASSTTINFGGIGGNPVISIPGLTSQLILTYTGMTTVAGNNVFTFGYDLSNTSTIAGGSRVSSFGFNVDPNAIGVSTSGTFDSASLHTNYPVGFGFVDVCFYDGPGGTCTGNGNGLTAGQHAIGNLSVTMAGLVNNITLSDFVDRYQAFDYGRISSGIGTQITSSVPEPGTWAMMILGIGMAGGAMRRKRTRVAIRAAA